MPCMHACDQALHLHSSRALSGTTGTPYLRDFKTCTEQATPCGSCITADAASATVQAASMGQGANLDMPKEPLQQAAERW